jgi:hypothetical protein
MAQERIWLDVAFDEKEAAKAAGARWDPQARRWFAPRPGMTALDPWRPRPPLPELLPGEDRTLGAGLFVDLVPDTCWFTNARSCVSQRDWERVRQMVVSRAGDRCEVCGADGDRAAQRWLEVHERWTYDDATRVQALHRLICLCTDCHRSTHFGLANIRGLAPLARAHLLAVTGMSQTEASSHIRAAFDLWQQRSRHTWTLDLSLLTDAEIELSPPPTAGARPAASTAALKAKGPTLGAV